jgi:hypothetical protein
MAHPDPHKQEAHLLISFLTLLIPLVLYIGRTLDDNRLTSWHWVFTAANSGWLFLLLLAMIPVLWLLARRPPVTPHPLHLVPASFLICLLFLDTPEVIVDASRYFLQAKLLREYGVGYFLREWGNEIFVWTDLPLMSFLYGLLFTIFGESRLVVQLFNAALFALTTYLTFMLGRDLWDEETGLYGGFLLLGFPFLYTQVPLMLVDVGTMFFLVLAMVTMRRALTIGGSGRISLAALSVAALFFVKYSAWVLLTVLVPVFFCSLGRDWRLAVRRGLLVALPTLGVIGLLLLARWETITVQLELLASYQQPGLKRWGESLISTFLFQTHPLLTAGVLYSAFRAWRLRDMRYLVVSYLVVLLLVILEIRRIRYSMPIFPLVALLAAYGIRDIKDREVRRHLALAIVGPSLLLAAGAFLPFLQSMGERNLQQAGNYLNKLAVDRVSVFILADPEPVLDPRVTIPLLDLFAARQLIYRPLAPTSAPPAWVAESPLRFTWELRLPALYFQPEPITAEAVVVISNSPRPELPPAVVANTAGLSRVRRFAEDTGIFQHRTFVVVYDRDAGRPEGLP